MLKRSRTLALNRGFTLVELVIGMLVLAVALTLITSVLGPMMRSSSETWHQVRAAELGHSLMNEITSRAFDENSPRGTTVLRCNQAGASACIASIPACPATGMSAATEESSRELYDDIDDYHCLRLNGTALSNILNESLADSYVGYQLSVTISYAGSDLAVANALMKRIDLQVTTPTGDALAFRSYKGNW
ncbi:MAG: prepilin-type N-terminal cleavage/methylation domain-containing protein [Rheinheimera sp.]|nr:prepilin-type N-terminal cleavage/methylation domain-containing protein [Gammaproteobacteria bacterium]MDZ7903604.1 prepilin-type N-terminal cleavage/methylation domain-containing protein [Rheinheimera sp.]